MSKDTERFYIEIYPVPTPKLFATDFGDKASIDWRWEVRGIDNRSSDMTTAILAQGVKKSRVEAVTAAEDWADALGQKESYFYAPRALNSYSE